MEAAPNTQKGREEIPETLRRHQEMFRMREKELKLWGTLYPKDILDRVNNPETYRDAHLPSV